MLVKRMRSCAPNCPIWSTISMMSWCWSMGEKAARTRFTRKVISWDRARTGWKRWTSEGSMGWVSMKSCMSLTVKLRNYSISRSRVSVQPQISSKTQSSKSRAVVKKTMSRSSSSSSQLRAHRAKIDHLTQTLSMEPRMMMTFKLS